mmetsp:Transcript_22122/g.40191  ORF Transcript_22122/g.40191 Transcript_22122/m.40191 type:complete len:80 (+) Transcript_22122:1710-1949(+)
MDYILFASTFVVTLRVTAEFPLKPRKKICRIPESPPSHHCAGSKPDLRAAVILLRTCVRHLRTISYSGFLNDSIDSHST